MSSVTLRWVTQTKDAIILSRPGEIFFVTGLTLVQTMQSFTEGGGGGREDDAAAKVLRKNYKNFWKKRLTDCKRFGDS